MNMHMCKTLLELKESGVGGEASAEKRERVGNCPYGAAAEDYLIADESIVESINRLWSGSELQSLMP